MWVRGLKLVQTEVRINLRLSHPMWVRGLKLSIGINIRNLMWSHPMWVRGLKQTMNANKIILIRSHPMWVRGLKHQGRENVRGAVGRILCGCVDWNWLGRGMRCPVPVASYVGAWIETSLQKSHSCAAHLCRTPCGCVDSNICLMKSSPRCNWRTPSAKMWRCTSSPWSCVALAKSTYISASHPSTLRRRYMPTS